MKLRIAMAGGVIACLLSTSAWAEAQAVAPPGPATRPTRDVGGTHQCGSYYPKLSKLKAEVGYVFLGYDVGADGVIINIRLFASSGFQRLDDAALACVRETWRNVPALKDNVPVASPGRMAVLRFWLARVPPEDDVFTRGVVAASQSRFDEALAAFNEEIGLKPDSARAYRARAAVYQASGRDDLATADVVKANRLSPPQ